MDTTKTTMQRLRNENRELRKTLKEIIQFIDSGERHEFYTIVKMIEKHQIYSKRGW